MNGIIMAANGLRSSPSISEILPSKRRNSTESVNAAPVEPVFKTPSPFWNQNFRRSKRSREPRMDLYSSATYHPQWTDAGCASNQVLLHPLGNNAIFSAWPPYFESRENFLGVLNQNGNELISNHDFYGTSSYCSYLPVQEQSDMLLKTYGRLSNPYKTKIIKPVPRSLASYCTGRTHHKDDPKRQFDTGCVRGVQWDERLNYESAKNDTRIRKRNYVREEMKQTSGSFADSEADLSRQSYYSELNNSSQANASKTEALQHQQFPNIPQSCFNKKQLKSSTGVTRRNEHPLLARSEKAETREEQEHALRSSQLLTRFFEGSLIELDSGRLKRVEDLQLEDFECCTASCPDFNLTSFTVKKITRSEKPGLMCLEVEVEDLLHSKISLEVCEEYPFFVCGRGWSSCHPDRTTNLCYLQCQLLHLGDTCLALTPVPVPPTEALQLGTDGFPKAAEEEHQSKQRRRHNSAPELQLVQ